jgi:hypothetical protein
VGVSCLAVGDLFDLAGVALDAHAVVLAGFDVCGWGLVWSLGMERGM